MDVHGINGIIGWICNHSMRNLWRVAHWYELEDLINDGLMIALKCREKLGVGVDDKLYHAYVRRAFHNHIGDLIRRKRGVDEVGLLDLVADPNDQDQCDAILPPTIPCQEVVVALRQLPSDFSRVLDLMWSDEPMRRRETMADRLYRLAGWRRDLDFAEEFAEYLLHG